MSSMDQKCSFQVVVLAASISSWPKHLPPKSPPSLYLEIPRELNSERKKIKWDGLINLHLLSASIMLEFRRLILLEKREMASRLQWRLWMEEESILLVAVWEELHFVWKLLKGTWTAGSNLAKRYQISNTFSLNMPTWPLIWSRQGNPTLTQTNSPQSSRASRCPRPQQNRICSNGKENGDLTMLKCMWLLSSNAWRLRLLERIRYWKICTRFKSASDIRGN